MTSEALAMHATSSGYVMKIPGGCRGPTYLMEEHGLLEVAAKEK